MTPGDELLFLPLGGSGEIGMNLNLYGTQGQWVMVDFGMSFADAATPGVDLVFPDIAFIEEQRDKLLGVVLTHGHEDHIGAIPYLVEDLGVPLYATPFTAGLIRHKLAEEGLEGKIKINTIPVDGRFKLGPFNFRYVSIAHSIPEGHALLIDTPYGKIFHTGDWKLDDEPIIGKPSTPQELSAIGAAGILAMVGDSTNVFNKQASGSEGAVRDAMLALCRQKKGRILVTTFASNVARLDTLGQVAQATGRHLAVAGRSFERMLRVGRETGYFKNFPPILPLEEVENVPRESLMIVCTGCQGEPQAALSRIASGEHSQIKLSKGDSVIFSSRKIPGNELSIGRIHNSLVAQGVEVITERDAFVHVSGHPGVPELQAMFGWIKPEILIPVHGEMRHMAAHAQLAQACGIAQTLVPKNGSIIRLAPKLGVAGQVCAGRLALDGDVIVPADGATMVQRRRLEHNGYLAATLVLSSKTGKLMAGPHIVQHGVPVEEDEATFKAECARAVLKVLSDTGARDIDKIVENARIAIRRLAREWTGKRPVAEVHILHV